MSECLTREAILAANDLKPEPIEVPEWGGHLYVRRMMADDGAKYEALIASAEDGKKAHEIWGQVVALSVCNESGERLFGEDDIEALGKKSIVALQRVAMAVLEINGVSRKDVEDMAKNLPGTGVNASE